MKPAVPSEDERTEHKGSMREDDDELTATLVTSCGYIVEARRKAWRIYLSTNKHNALTTWYSGVIFGAYRWIEEAHGSFSSCKSSIIDKGDHRCNDG